MAVHAHRVRPGVRRGRIITRRRRPWTGTNCGKPFPEGVRFCPHCKQVRDPPSVHDVPADYLDFQLLGWVTDANRISVMVDVSPAGSMRRPVEVSVDVAKIREQDTHIEDFIEHGKSLGKAVLPSPVLALLAQSLDSLGIEQGLRLRLCLDDELIDLDWELIYVESPESYGLRWEFLSLDDCISIVREPPIARPRPQPSARRRRMIFAGAFWPHQQDTWQVKEEYALLEEAMRPVQNYIDASFISASGQNITDSLSTPTDIFHYAGLVDVKGQNGELVREMKEMEGGSMSYETLSCRVLAKALNAANVKLAVFTACNSGQWEFVKPLIRAKIPLIIGLHDSVTNVSASLFVAKLYAYLAIGLSIDEAVTGARLHMLERANEFPQLRHMLGLSLWSICARPSRADHTSLPSQLRSIPALHLACEFRGPK